MHSSLLGETGSMGLISPGEILIRPLYNDVFGLTDKHLSGEIAAEAAKRFDDNIVGSIRIARFFITPALSPNFNSNKFDSPVGRFSDTILIESSAVFISDFNKNFKTRTEISVGLDKSGGNGAEATHRALHTMLGDSSKWLTYENGESGYRPLYSISKGIIFNPSLNTSITSSLGFEVNRFTEDLNFNAAVLFKLDDYAHISTDFRFFRNINSDVYGRDFTNERNEFAVGFRLNNWIPSIRYVSPYLRSDDYPQIFFDPLAYSIKF